MWYLQSVLKPSTFLFKISVSSILKEKEDINNVNLKWFTLLLFKQKFWYVYYRLQNSSYFCPQSRIQPRSKQKEPGNNVAQGKNVSARSKERSGVRIKMESETGERRQGHVRSTCFARQYHAGASRLEKPILNNNKKLFCSLYLCWTIKIEAMKNVCSEHV